MCPLADPGPVCFQGQTRVLRGDTAASTSVSTPEARSTAPATLVTSWRQTTGAVWVRVTAALWKECLLWAFFGSLESLLQTHECVWKVLWEGKPQCQVGPLLGSKLSLTQTWFWLHPGTCFWVLLLNILEGSAVR